MTMMAHRSAFCALALLTMCLLLISNIEAAPSPSNSNGNANSVGVGVGYNYNNNEVDDMAIPDDLLLALMSRFGRTILRARNDLENDEPLSSYSSSKRTVDFGLARGYSGTQEAKHRMGLAAANFPGGPGRRRRSETEA